MFTKFSTKQKSTRAGVASKVLGALAIGASAAVVGLKTIDRVRQSMRAKVRAALKPKLSKEDHEAIARMEGEGGPSRPVARPSAPAAVL